MSTDALDVSALPIATKVRKHVSTEFYAILLAEIQQAAMDFDYHFADDATATLLPSVFIDHLAWRMDHARVTFLNPQLSSERTNGWVSDSLTHGYAQAYLMSILEALAAQGISLEEGPEAAPRIQAEEIRRANERDKVTLDCEALFKDFLDDNVAASAGLPDGSAQ